MSRPQISDEEIEAAFHQVNVRMKAELASKGHGILVSSHECLGVVVEEVDEYRSAVQRNQRDEQEHELADIAVAAIFSLASMKSGKQDW